MIKTYYLLTKPGIIVGNAITVAAGVALASKGNLDFWLFLETLVGLSLVIASACVFNNYIDREADKKMERTKNRALAKGMISVNRALIFAILLGIVGFVILSLYTNLLTVLCALAGFLIYVVLYSFWKYHTTYGTIIGSIAGAVPPVVGYTAVTNHFDFGAFLLFLILVLWQMPHFYSIAMYRFDDYTAASIPILPIKKGVSITKIHMLCYIIAFILTSLMLFFFGYTGHIYLIIATIFGISWLLLCMKGFKSQNTKRWGRQMFVLSLFVVTALCVTMAIDVI